MKSLQDLGFELGGDEAHLQKVAPEDINPERFFDQAEPLLEELSESVLTEVVPNLEDYEGRWHPLGFMIYPLGVHEGLGSLRLHIWPAGHRVSIDGGSGIHDHAWYLASRVLAGVYSDDRYDVELMPDKAPEGDLSEPFFRVFGVTKVPGEPDGLRTDGTYARAQVFDQVLVPAGLTHRIEPGAFHLPTISEGQLAATLVLDSPSLGFKPSILINRSSEPIFNPRPAVHESEALQVKDQILSDQQSS